MKKAFTLAEVLITLMIIGIIAVLTIPNLMRKWEDQHTVSAVKKAYSIFDNAFKMAIKEEGAPVTDWGNPKLSGGENGNIIGEKLKPFLKIKKYCGTDHSKRECISYAQWHVWGWGYYKYLNGGTCGEAGYTPNYTNYIGGTMMLDNGMTAAFVPQWPRGSIVQWGTWGVHIYKDYIGYMIVDINGKKGPNQYGFDVFLFSFGGDGLMVSDVLSNYNNGNFPAAQKSNCYNKSSKGFSCGSWIMLHNNVDYKYRNISAEW